MKKFKFTTNFQPIDPWDLDVFNAFIMPEGSIVPVGRNHGSAARALGYDKGGKSQDWGIANALKDGCVRLSSDGTFGRYVDVWDLKKSLPVIQEALLPFYENHSDSHLIIEERKSKNVWPSRLSTLVLGTEKEVRHGFESNPPKALRAEAERLLRRLTK